MRNRPERLRLGQRQARLRRAQRKARAAYLLAGAPSASWREPVPGTEFFGSATWHTTGALVRDAYLRWWRVGSGGTHPGTRGVVVPNAGARVVRVRDRWVRLGAPSCPGRADGILVERVAVRDDRLTTPPSLIRDKERAPLLRPVQNGQIIPGHPFAPAGAAPGTVGAQAPSNTRSRIRRVGGPLDALRRGQATH